MEKIEPKILNKFGEKLDTWVESLVGEVKANIIMVHGFGTNKHETDGYFDDISKALVNDNFRVIRFDFSGYGKSEGKQEDACHSKHVGDLDTVITYTKDSFTEPCYIFAQSMGCFVTALTSPDGITKTIMTGIPNADPETIIKRVVDRFGSRPGAKLDMNGVSELPRSTGMIQKIGKSFWEDIQKLNPVKVLEAYSKKTKLLIVHWLNDEIIGTEHLSKYDEIPTVKADWLSGNHSVTNLDDRKNFIIKMLDFYNN